MNLIIKKNNNLKKLNNITFRSDSNIIMQNSIFILNNKNLPYINSSLINGNIGVLIDDSMDESLINKDLIIIKVPNILIFCQKLIPLILKNSWIIGITGSAGKTTLTKNLTDFFQLTKTNFRNYNTPEGLILSILSTNNDIWINTNGEILSNNDTLNINTNPIINPNKSINNLYIYELGISKPQDMDSLLEVIQPNIAIILPINFSHSENFNSLDDLIKEKLKIINPKTLLVIAPQKYRQLVDYNQNWIDLETLLPKAWIVDQWRSDDIYDEFIENIGNCCKNFINNHNITIN